MTVGLCACSAPGSNTPPASVPGVSTLWPDVPVFAGSTPDLASNQFFVNHFSVGHGQGPQIPYGRTAGGCSEFRFHDKPAADCTFSKTDEAGRNVELTIFIGPDDKSDLTLIDYTRMVGSAPKK